MRKQVKKQKRIDNIVLVMSTLLAILLNILLDVSIKGKVMILCLWRYAYSGSYFRSVSLLPQIFRCPEFTPLPKLRKRISLNSNSPYSLSGHNLGEYFLARGVYFYTQHKNRKGMILWQA
ncbi:hypothetical protein IO98_13385 [Lacrimispora celerecrescens]|uniref:Uncharacterized protein n=1 Tax=Lacrimispora celerecrescens TaxID=29354 RepID=A0A084JL45_9FIRM|nr:hypothetical protein IO98_13385 [Lacrimispora celerecrescens]